MVDGGASGSVLGSNTGMELDTGPPSDIVTIHGVTNHTLSDYPRRIFSFKLETYQGLICAIWN